MKKVILFWAGGRDSALMLNKLKNNHDYKVISLVTIFNNESNELTNHGTPETLINLQAKMLGIPVIRTYDSCENTETSIINTVERFKYSFKNKEINTLAFGDISKELKSTLEKTLLAQEIDILSMNNESDLSSIEAIINTKHRAIVSALDESKIELRWLGKELDQNFLNYLETINDKDSYKSFVCFGPTFKQRVPFSKNITVKKEILTQCKLREA